MVLEQRNRRLDGAHRLVLPLLILLACALQGFGQPILRQWWTTNPVTPANTEQFGTGLTPTIKDSARLTNSVHVQGSLYTNDGAIVVTFDPALNNTTSIDFNQGGLTTPLFRILANTGGDRLRFYNSGNLMLDLAGSVISYTNTFVQNGFRMDTSTVFQDNELITEARLQTVISELAAQTFYLWTNAHPIVAGTRLLSVSQSSDAYLTNTLAAGSNHVATWLTTNVLGGGTIKPGSYQFHVHGFAAISGVAAVTIGWDLVRTNGAGIVTLATGDSTAVTVNDSSYLLHAHVQSETAVSTNDFIGIRLYATRTGAGLADWITHVGGTTDSHLETPNLNAASSFVASSGGTVSNVTLIGSVTVPVVTNAASTVTNTVNLGAYNLAGFGVPYWTTDSGNLFLAENSIFHERLSVTHGALVPFVLGGGALNASGSYLGGLGGGIASADPEYFGSWAGGYVTTASSNSVAYINPDYGLCPGTKNKQSGYLLSMKFAVTNGNISIGGGGIGFFAGACQLQGGAIGTIVQETNANVEKMGVQVFGNMGSSNFFWVSRDTAGNEFRRDTTLGLIGGNWYQFSMYVPPMGRTAGWKLQNLDTGAYSNSFETSSFCTNVLSPALAICNRTNFLHIFVWSHLSAISDLNY